MADPSIDLQREANGLEQRPHPDSAATQAGVELEAETRPLAIGARAHMIVQRTIDEMPDWLRVIEHSDGTKEPIASGRMGHADHRAMRRLCSSRPSAQHVDR